MAPEQAKTDEALTAKVERDAHAAKAESDAQPKKQKKDAHALQKASDAKTAKERSEAVLSSSTTKQSSSQTRKRQRSDSEASGKLVKGAKQTKPRVVGNEEMARSGAQSLTPAAEGRAAKERGVQQSATEPKHGDGQLMKTTDLKREEDDAPRGKNSTENRSKSKEKNSPVEALLDKLSLALSAKTAPVVSPNSEGGDDDVPAAELGEPIAAQQHEVDGGVDDAKRSDTESESETVQKIIARTEQEASEKKRGRRRSTKASPTKLDRELTGKAAGGPPSKKAKAEVEGGQPATSDTAEDRAGSENASAPRKTPSKAPPFSKRSSPRPGVLASGVGNGTDGGDGAPPLTSSEQTRETTAQPGGDRAQQGRRASTSSLGSAGVADKQLERAAATAQSEAAKEAAREVADMVMSAPVKLNRAVEQKTGLVAIAATPLLLSDDDEETEKPFTPPQTRAGKRRLQGLMGRVSSKKKSDRPTRQTTRVELTGQTAFPNLLRKNTDVRNRVNRRHSKAEE